MTISNVELIDKNDEIFNMMFMTNLYFLCYYFPWLTIHEGLSGDLVKLLLSLLIILTNW